MSRLDALLAHHPLPTWRSVAWPAAALTAAFIAWASVAEVDEVAVAVGEVAPRGKVKVIQHLEGGIIQAIHVHEGSVVRIGDPLVNLDLATSGANRDELQARLDGDQLRRARLLAEAEGSPLALPQDAVRRQPRVAEAERRTHEARLRELDSGLAVLREQRRQRRLEVDELEAKRRAALRNLALAQERLKLSASLLQDGLTARMEHLQLQSDAEKLNGEVQSLNQSVPRAEAAVAEAERRLAEGADRFHRDARDQLGDVEVSISRVTEVLAQATDQGLRADIRSPIDGVVKKLRYNTIGGVVAPGEPIMEIVPSDDRLVVEARLSPIDRGYVHSGQSATVKVTTYDFIRYGSLDAQVTTVAPDTTTDPQTGRAWFDVIVETERAFLGTSERPLPISAGMQATVDIHTGRRTVLSYLITPVLKLGAEAFHER